MIYIIIIFIILLLAITIRKYNYKEHLTTLSNEAIQDLASMYNGETLNVQNLCVNKGETINCLTSDTIHKLNAMTQSGGIRNSNMFNSNECLVYQNIFDAKNANANVIAKLGSPSGYDDTTYVNQTSGYKKINYGNGDQDGNGMKITVPSPPSGSSFATYTVVWLRFLNDRYNYIKVIYDDGELAGFFGTGYRNLNTYSPDGGVYDGMFPYDVWFPIPVPLINTGTKKNFINIINKIPSGATTLGGWISGIAFSTNPWNLAMNSGMAYWVGLNDLMSWNSMYPDQGSNNSDTTLPTTNGSNGIEYSNYNNPGSNGYSYQLANYAGTGTSRADGVGSYLTTNKTRTGLYDDQYFEFKKSATFNVPIIISGNDKLLYIINHNDNWNSVSFSTVFVNGTQIESFRTTYQNPFAVHFNSKPFQRFIAARIPKSILTNTVSKVIQVKITSNNDTGAYMGGFREIGTMDA